MQVITELNAGDWAFVLHENKVQQKKVLNIQVTSSNKEPNPEVRYQVGEGDKWRRDLADEDAFWVPAERAAKTKEALLAKL